MTAKLPPITLAGGCACGAIRYESSAPPVNAFNCYCRACQRATGSAFSSVLFVPTSAFRLTRGAPKYFITTGDSGGKVERGFCVDCGSPTLSRLSAYPEIIGIVAASLDDPSRHQPMVELFTANAPAWMAFNPATHKFPGAPPAK